MAKNLAGAGLGERCIEVASTAARRCPLVTFELLGLGAVAGNQRTRRIATAGPEARAVELLRLVAVRRPMGGRLGALARAGVAATVDNELAVPRRTGIACLHDVDLVVEA